MHSLTKHLNEIRTRVDEAKKVPDNYWGSTFVGDVDRLGQSLRVAVNFIDHLKWKKCSCGEHQKPIIQQITKIMNGTNSE